MKLFAKPVRYRDVTRTVDADGTASKTTARWSAFGAFRRTSAKSSTPATTEGAATTSSSSATSVLGLTFARTRTTTGGETNRTFSVTMGRRGLAIRKENVKGDPTKEDEKVTQVNAGKIPNAGTVEIPGAYGGSS